MPAFGTQSLTMLKQVHPQLQGLLTKVVAIYDIKLLEGSRTVAQQRLNVAKGVSQTMNSMHIPAADGYSHAVDVAPYPVDWGTTGSPAQKARAINRFYVLAGMMFAFASESKVNLRWGGDWDKDWDFSDQTFNDLGHFEIKL